MEHRLWLLNERNHWLPYKCIQPHLGDMWVFVFVSKCISVRASANTNFNWSVHLLVFFSLSNPTGTGKKNVAKHQVEMPFVAMVTSQLADKEDCLSCRDLKSHVSPRSLFIWFLTGTAHFARWKPSHLQSDVPHSSPLSFAVKPTVIDVGIYVNSIGPVSSIDMVSPSAPSHYSSLRSCSLCPQVKARGNAGGRTRGSSWIKQMSWVQNSPWYNKLLSPALRKLWS